MLQLFESAGLEYRPSNIFGFLTQSESAFIKELVPKGKTWHPIPNELDVKYEEDTGNDGTTEHNATLAVLKDFSPTLALSYSDESNREGYRVVHWRDS